jgi:hypothetical protein
MPSISRSTNWIIMVLLFISVAGSHISFAKDKKLTPEALIAEHIKSIGSPTVLQGIRSRAVIGVSTVRFLQGATGQLSGQAQIASDGHRLGIDMRKSGVDYLGEHFAFDGKDVTIGRFAPGWRSPLADFIYQYSDVIKEGLFCGVLSLSWPLLKIEEMKPRLTYNQIKIQGRQMHALRYRPRKGLGDFKILLIFDPETFHHIRTEYELLIQPGMGTFLGGGSPGTESSADVPDTHFLLSEDFANFKEVDGMMLPQRYTISISAEGRVKTYLTHWIFDAKQWIHNGQIDSRIFRAPE